MDEVSYITVVFWALVGGLFSLLGGIILLSSRRLAQKVSRLAIPFAAGALLAASFFDLLPEAVEIAEASSVFLWVIIAMVVFFLLEQYLDWFHHHHDHSDSGRKKATAPLIIIGDTLHNAIDGVVIGAAFLISAPVGIVTTIAVAAHEIPQEIGDFGVLLKTGMRRVWVLIWNAVSSLSTLVAALITFWLGNSEDLPLGAIIGLSAGLLIYIALSDLVPTIHDETKGRFSPIPAVLLIMGILVVFWATNLAHGYIGDEHSHNGTSHQEEGEAQRDKEKHHEDEALHDEDHHEE